MRRILCSLLVTTLPIGGVLADAPKSKNAKVTVVYQHELPNVPCCIGASPRFCATASLTLPRQSRKCWRITLRRLL